ncbi:MAG: LVIVD repeat-containing protein [Janthinobacterium lividum]
MLLTRRTSLASLGALAAGSVRPRHGQAQPASRIKHLGYSDQGGRPDGVQVMVSRKHLFVGHMFSNGFTVLDISDPAAPRPVNFITNGPNTRSHHLQTNGDLLLVANGADIPTLQRYNPGLSYYQNSFAEGMQGKGGFAAGLRIYDISKPAEPREIAFLDMPGIGINRLWYSGGRYAYVAAHLDGFTDHILVVVDVQDPAKPAIAGRWWLPGMWRDGGETPTWKNRVALHHMIVAGALGYAAWRDGGFTILDLADPTKPKLLSHTNTAPPYPGGTHTPLPLPGRGLAVLLDESSSLNCAKGLSYTWLYDVRDPSNPVSISTLPTPSEQPFCRPGENFGPHNLHENRPETFQSEDMLFATYHNAGLRIFDIKNPYAPREVDRFVAPPPTRILDPRPGNALAPQTCDVNVQPDGTIYLSDWNAGLHVLHYDL